VVLDCDLLFEIYVRFLQVQAEAAAAASFKAELGWQCYIVLGRR
jgi:hypothetical protein